MLKEPARELRKNSTLSEVLLWRYLKGRQMLGHDFDRQKPIGNFIVDFFCNELMLAIEIDGDSHNAKVDQDIERLTPLRAFRTKNRDIIIGLGFFLLSIAYAQIP